MSSALKLLDVSPEDKNYRDLSPEELKFEKHARLYWLAIGAILTIGGLVTLYLSLPSGSYSFKIAESLILTSIGSGSLVYGVVYDEEEEKNGTEINYKKEENRTFVARLLREGTYEAVFERFYRNHGGVGSLVRNGFLTRKQAEELNALFSQTSPIEKQRWETLQSNIAKNFTN